VTTVTEKDERNISFPFGLLKVQYIIEFEQQVPSWLDLQMPTQSVSISTQLKNKTEDFMLKLYVCCVLVCLMVFNATFNNISVISWRSVLFVKETGVPGENHPPVASISNRF
jgi:hypothetical protein